MPLKNIRSGALIDFRNLIAICCILNAWQAYLLRGQWFTLGQYSEYFSLYPIVPNDSNKYLVIFSPAVHGIDLPSQFSGQTIPELGGPAYEIEHDPYIFSSLINEWERKHIRGRLLEPRINILFRSLNVAVQASSIPDTNWGSIFDYGARLMQWVSAFEILARPSINQNVSKENVLNLIGRFPFSCKNLKYKRYIVSKRNSIVRRGNLSQCLCHQIYKARHDFTHGNPVTSKSVFPWYKTQRYPLNYFAPLIYKILLICYLGIHPNKSIYEIANLPYEQFKSIRGLEGALIKSTSDISA